MTEHWRALTDDGADCCELLARLKEEYNAQHDEIERLNARIVELEAALAATTGTLEMTHHGGVPFSVTESPPTTPR